MKSDLEQAKRLILLGDLESAKDLFKKTLKQEPENSEALHGLGFLYFHEKNYKKSEEYLSRAIQCDGKNPELFTSLGTLYLATDSWEKAAEAFRSAKKSFESLGQDKDIQKYINVLLKLASVYIRQLKFPEAKDALKTILKYSPDNVAALKFLAQVYVAHLQFYHAIETLEKLRLEKGTLDALKAEIFLLKKDYRNALHCAKNAVRHQPDNPRHYELLGDCYIKTDELEKSIDAFKRGLKLAPNHPKMLSRLLSLMIRVCEWNERGEVISRLRSLAREAGEPVMYLLPTIAILSGFSNKEILEIAKVRCKTIDDNAKPVRDRLHFTFANPPSEKIKIGYLSSDFHDHATAHLMLDLFAFHDRKKFEISAYSYGKNDRSELRKKIQHDCDHFHEVSKLSDIKVAEKIHSDGIHILVDLKGHIIDQRMDILAFRPAPLQLHYLGYPGTIGAPFIDYLIADSYLIPKEERQYYSESIIYMPYTYQVNTVNKTIQNPLPARKEYNIPKDAFAFCCFNQNDKFDTETVTLWMKILSQVPGSVLWIWGNYENIGKKIKAFGEQFGIQPGRLIVSPTEPNPRHLARIQLADLFLDTLYYNAHTSCSDALRVGLPVLTSPGKTFASRVAASLLKLVKGDALIAKSPEDYVEKAVYYANHPEKLKIVREKILRNLPASHIYDPKLFAAHLDQAFIQIWERHLSGKKPQDLRIRK